MTSALSPASEPLIIAELACTHNGDFDRARALVEAVHSTGATAIKFQIFRAQDLCAPSHPDFSVFERLSFSQAEWERIIASARARDLKVYTDVFSLDSLRFCQRMRVDGFKIHSSDLANEVLLAEVAANGGPVFLGVGGSALHDIDSALAYFSGPGQSDVILMLGHQAFPTPLTECQLHKIAWFRDAFGLKVGYADHIDGGLQAAVETPVLAAALGAAVIEKHITLNRAEKPEDYEASLDPDDFREMVTRIRQTRLLLGEARPTFSENEKSYARKMKKHPCAQEKLAEGQMPGPANLCYVRTPATSLLRPLRLSEFSNRRLLRPVEKDAPLSWIHLESKVVALVNARMLSRRLPRKALMSIAGKPALLWLFERLQTCCSFSQIILCTTRDESDDELQAFAEARGIAVYRGETEDVMARLLGAATNVGADHIVRITGDDILSDPSYIDLAVEAHLSNNADYTSVSGLPSGLDREIINVKALQWVHTHAHDHSMTEYMTWYLDDPFRLAAQTLPAKEEHFFPQGRLTLDTREDFALMESLLLELAPTGQHLSTEAVIAYLKNYPPALSEAAGKMITRDRVDTSLDLRRSH